MLGFNPCIIEERAELGGLQNDGEVSRRAHPCVTTSMSDGVTAAKAIQNKLELKMKLAKNSEISISSSPWTYFSRKICSPVSPELVPKNKYFPRRAKL